MWDQNLSWLQLTFHKGQHESNKAAPFGVIFPFRTGSRLHNQLNINELLPDKFNKRVLKQKWTAVSKTC
jgi:hypothetical protein